MEQMPLKREMHLPALSRIICLAACVCALGFASLCAETVAGNLAGGALESPSQSILPSDAGTPEIAALRIKLPFSEGTRYTVYQGNHGSFSHSGLNDYAWDFGMPEGTPVCAAAQGKVVRVKQDSGLGGTTLRDFALANTIIIDHGNGYFTQYLHLKQNSAFVKEGEVVQGGQVIALSGNTGFSSTPHLHFQVQDATGQSLPAAFLDVPGDGIPRHGGSYTSGNDGTGVSTYAGESILPLDTFKRNMVQLTTTDLPAHLLKVDQSYHLRGKIARRAKKVAIYVMHSGGGGALLAVFAEVDANGNFSSRLDLSKLRTRTPKWSEDPSQSNSFALAVTAVEDDGSYWSNFSVPITVR